VADREPDAAREEAHTIVERDDVHVMFKRASDEQASITRAWSELESLVGSQPVT
jgi:hypothetical protein